MATDRRRLQELLHENSEAIVSLRIALAAELSIGSPQGDPLKYDDIWLLRYVLSFAAKRGGLPAAETAARRALAWRREHAALLAAAADRRAPPGVSESALAAFEAFAVLGFHNLTRLGDPVFIVRVSCCDQEKLMDELSVEVVSLLLTYVAECAYQFQDWKSRTEGHLVKTLNIQDLTNIGFRRAPRFFQALGEASKRHEWLYPQKDMKNVMFRPPSWVHWAFSIFRRLMSSGAMEKVCMHCPVPLPGEAECDLGRCPFASQLLDIASTPTLYGGEDREGVVGVPDDVFGNWSSRHPGEMPSPSFRIPGSGLRHVRRLPRIQAGPHKAGELLQQDPAALSAPVASAPAPQSASETGFCRRCCCRRRRGGDDGRVLLQS